MDDEAIPTPHAWREALIARASSLSATLPAPTPTAICHPCDVASLEAAFEAEEAGLITPLLVGPEARLRSTAKAAGRDISHLATFFSEHSHDSATKAVALVRSGKAQLLMKGALHTDELMHAVMDPNLGLRTGRRVSHVYVVSTQAYPRPLLITDAAINIAPDLDAKRDIVQNAIDLAHILGVASPRVAILSAVETVTSKIPSTLDAAALCKMADRGQITGGRLDGPLAFDNAVNLDAAADKAIVSEVAGQADILVVPDLVSGNILAKLLIYLTGADAAGVVMGSRAPLILTSRADSKATRIASCAVAVLLAQDAASLKTALKT